MFFKWVRISTDVDWYHHQGASPAPTCMLQMKNDLVTIKLILYDMGPGICQLASLESFQILSDPSDQDSS